jgi:hypothetical protein
MGSTELSTAFKDELPEYIVQKMMPAKANGIGLYTQMKDKNIKNAQDIFMTANSEVQHT